MSVIVIFKSTYIIKEGFLFLLSNKLIKKDNLFIILLFFYFSFLTRYTILLYAIEIFPDSRFLLSLRDTIHEIQFRCSYLVSSISKENKFKYTTFLIFKYFNYLFFYEIRFTRYEIRILFKEG